MKETKIYEGKPQPDTYWVGTNSKPNETKDKFGEIRNGEVRFCLINTRWGQLSVPLSWMKKRIKIQIIEVK